MLLRYFYDDKLAQAAYMVACQASGEAIVIDPARDITPYLRTAEQEGLRITLVTETHIHADYVSGTRELAAATGATMLLSDEGDADWKYAFADDPNVRLLKDGDTWMLGNIKFQVIHTPGHTPEHLTFMLTDTAAADAPMGLFTGDFLFVGDVGRPDLLEEAAGIANTAEPGARLQFRNVQKFKGMPDYLQVWPGHGAGSACGKALGAVPSSTLGYEKRFNPAFRFAADEEDAFVEWLLSDQPAAPRYFAQMKTVNKRGPALLSELDEPQQLAADQLQPLLEQGALLVDTRSIEAFARGHIPGTLNVPGSSGSFSTYVGWYVDFDKPTALITSERLAGELINDLRAVGVDNIAGWFPLDVVQGAAETIEQVEPQALHERLQRNGIRVVDVRNADEYRSGHIPGALNIPYGWLPRHLDALSDTAVVTHCETGIRSGVAASLLKKHGLQVIDMQGGFTAWEQAGLPTENGESA